MTQERYCRISGGMKLRQRMVFLDTFTIKLGFSQDLMSEDVFCDFLPNIYLNEKWRIIEFQFYKVTVRNET